MTKGTRAQHTLEFNEEAVCLVSVEAVKRVGSSVTKRYLLGRFTLARSLTRRHARAG